MKTNINFEANELCDFAVSRSNQLRIGVEKSAQGARILDFGIRNVGGIEAGILLSQICMGGEANVEMVPSDDRVWQGPQIQVKTDAPVIACMAAQYAGWPIQLDKYFAMGSGPMRSQRGREHVLEALEIVDEGDCAVGVLETDKPPTDDVCQWIAEACQVEPSRLTLCVAPTRSLAGTIQVVARSVETCLHKMFELKFDLRSIVSAYGAAPLPPPAIDFAKGIGRTNDAILYGGKVTLWLDCEDASIESIASQIPSSASSDWGEPFARIFKKYNYDFYKVDPGLFSPAEVSLVNLRSGKSWRCGELRPDVLRQSFTS